MSHTTENNYGGRSIESKHSQTSHLECPPDSGLAGLHLHLELSMLGDSRKVDQK